VSFLPVRLVRERGDFLRESLPSRGAEAADAVCANKGMWVYYYYIVLVVIYIYMRCLLTVLRG
jgi:hypothetical protein